MELKRETADAYVQNLPLHEQSGSCVTVAIVDEPGTGQSFLRAYVRIPMRAYSRRCGWECASHCVGEHRRYRTRPLSWWHRRPLRSRSERARVRVQFVCIRWSDGGAECFSCSCPL